MSARGAAQRPLSAPPSALSVTARAAAGARPRGRSRVPEVQHLRRAAGETGLHRWQRGGDESFLPIFCCCYWKKIVLLVWWYIWQAFCQVIQMEEKKSFVWICLKCFEMYCCRSVCLQWHFPAPFNKHMLSIVWQSALEKGIALLYCQNNCIESHYFHVSKAGFYVVRSSCDFVYSHPTNTEGAISGELFFSNNN